MVIASKYTLVNFELKKEPDTVLDRYKGSNEWVNE